MIRSIRKWKRLLCILVVVLIAFVSNAFARDGFSLAEKVFHQLAGCGDTFPSAPCDKENHAVLGHVNSSVSYLHKDMPRRIASDYAAAGQEPVSDAAPLAAAAFSSFNTNLFGSLHLSFQVVQRK